MDTTQPRHELKYFIPVAEAPRLRNKLEKVLHRDVHGDAYDAYHIRSLYFDDAMSSASFDKYSGVKDRAKYRIRMYGLNERALYLERKRKIGDLIAKDGQRITRRLAEQLMTGDPTGLEKLPDPLFHDMFVQMRLNLLRPVVIVDYHRQAYTHPAEHVRITFDRDVRSGGSRLDLFDGALPTIPAGSGSMILEVKYDRFLPDFIPPLLGSILADRSAISTPCAGAMPEPKENGDIAMNKIAPVQHVHHPRCHPPDPDRHGAGPLPSGCSFLRVLATFKGSCSPTTSA